MTIQMLYEYASQYVGKVNTVAVSPVLLEPATTLTLSRIFEWNTLHKSLVDIATELAEGHGADVQQVLHLAYTPVISKY